MEEVDEGRLVGGFRVVSWLLVRSTKERAFGATGTVRLVGCVGMLVVGRAAWLAGREVVVEETWVVAVL